jgi:hypothetical protein
MSAPNAKIVVTKEMRNEMNENLEIPRKDIERMIEENDADAKYWEIRDNSTMAEWHRGRASMLRLALSLWG